MRAPNVGTPQREAQPTTINDMRGRRCPSPSLRGPSWSQETWLPYTYLAGFDMMDMIASASDQFNSAGYCLTGQSVRPCAPVSVSDLKVNQQRQVALQTLAGQKPGFRRRTGGGGPASYRGRNVE
jgi:hypothetical protein